MQKLFKKLFIGSLGFYINSLAYLSPRKAARKAFRVFSKPRQGRIGPHHQDFLDSNLEPKIEIEGLTIQPYKWAGTGKTIVLVHGWESHSHRWKEMIIRLQKENYNIIAFDAPAHGYSSGKYLYVPIYSKVLDQVIAIYKPSFLIGHSMGGMTVLYNQAQDSARSMEKLVILGSPDRLESLVDQYRAILGLNKKAIEALEIFFMRRFNFRTKDFSSSAFAKKIQTPTLLIHDKEDTITPVTGSQAIHKALKNSEYIETQGLNHSLYDKQVNEKIITFLSK